MNFYIRSSIKDFLTYESSKEINFWKGIFFAKITSGIGDVLSGEYIDIEEARNL